MPGAPIYLPQKPNIWRDMLPSLVQMYAKGMMMDKFKEDDAFTLGEGDIRYKGKQEIARGREPGPKKPQIVTLKETGKDGKDVFSNYKVGKDNELELFSTGARWNKDGGRGSGSFTNPQKETRFQNLIGKFMPTKDKFGQYEEITPEQRMPRFVGWLRSREREAKLKIFSKSELDRGEQAIMTNLRFDMKTQDKVRELRKKDAPLSEIAKALKKGNELGASTSPEGTTATDAKGNKIITKNGKWVPFEGLQPDVLPPREMPY